MKNFSTIPSGQKINTLICTCDVTGFARLSREKGIEAVLCLMNDFTSLVNERIKTSSGSIIKYIGDSALIIFPEDAVDEGVALLLSLKKDIETSFSRRNLRNRITFSLHFGEVIVARFKPFDTIDILGDAVNTAFLIDRGDYRGRFVITPQVFRKLKPETRKKFHKYTPPVVYLAE
ncbi:MAG: adenylate/guanylate cyclase domain-containing protein [Spirochaetales bacterium]|nr:adenylate/guanylate cyclase domain-containing protein [Spirochaetales bacterium]